MPNTISKKTYAALSAASVIALMGSLSSTAYADEIVVTGTKQNRGVQDTPTSVSVVTGAAIEQRAILDIEDILQRTANVSTGGGDAINNLTLRGIQLSGDTFDAQGGAAQVYVDGAPASFNANQSAANLWDISQIEILRGPQASTQGRSALAGAIVIRTNDPTYEYSGTARVIVGNQNNRQYSGVLNAPIIEDQVAVRLVADYREVDFETAASPGGVPQRFQDGLALRGKVLIEPNAIPGLKLKLTGQYSDTDAGEFNTVFAPDAVGTAGFDAFDPFGDVTFPPTVAIRNEDNELTRGIVDLEYELSDNWTLYGIGTLEDVNRVSLRDSGSAAQLDTFDRVYSGELRAAFDYDRLSGWVGGYYFDLSQSSGGFINFAVNDLLGGQGLPQTADPADSVLSLISSNRNDTRNYAFFGSATYQVTDKLSVTFGARYDNEEFSSFSEDGGSITPATCTATLPLPPTFAPTPIPCAGFVPESTVEDVSAEFGVFLPNGSITYDIDDDRSISFLAGRGYRSGGAFLRVDATSSTGFELREFDPEFLVNYELAFRSQWWDDRLTVNANIFYSDWSDQQIQIQGLTGFLDQDIVNAGQSNLYGAELSIVAEPTEGLTLFSTLGLLETEFDEFTLGDDTDLSGNEFAQAPNVTFSAGFDYEHPSGVYTNWNVSYAGERFSDPENIAANIGDSYTLVNARIGYRVDPVNIYVFANNIFDERYIQRQQVVNPATATPTAQPFFVINEPRLFGVAVQASF